MRERGSTIRGGGQRDRVVPALRLLVPLLARPDAVAGPVQPAPVLVVDQGIHGRPIERVRRVQCLTVGPSGRIRVGSGAGDRRALARKGAQRAPEESAWGAVRCEHRHLSARGAEGARRLVRDVVIDALVHRPVEHLHLGRGRRRVRLVEVVPERSPGHAGPHDDRQQRGGRHRPRHAACEGSDVQLKRLPRRGVHGSRRGAGYRAFSLPSRGRPQAQALGVAPNHVVRHDGPGPLRSSSSKTGVGNVIGCRRRVDAGGGANPYAKSRIRSLIRSDFPIHDRACVR